MPLSDANISESLTNLTSDMTETSLTNYERASGILWSVISPILLLIGLVGNTTAFLVLFKLFRKKQSTFHLFLAVLSLNDLVVLFSGLLRYWLLNDFDTDVRDLNNASCKIQLYVIYTSMQYSAWILVSVTLQRCMIVARPSKFTQMYTPKAAGIQLAVIFFILSAINFHFFFTNGIIGGSCNSLTDAIYKFEEYVFVWVDLFILCLIPFAIMLLSNIYFMMNVQKYSAVVNKSDDVIGKKIMHSIRIIMRLTWLFLATNLPVSLFLIFDSYYKDDQDGLITLVHSICFLIQYAGFSLNICLYVSVDRKFVSVLRTKARKIESSFSSRNTFQLKRVLSYSSKTATTETQGLQTQKVQTETSLD